MLNRPLDAPLEGGAAALPAWNLLFAQEPQADLDLEDSAGDADKTMMMGSPGKGPDQPKGSNKTLLIALAVVGLGAAAYFAMDPDAMMALFGGAPEEPAMTAMPAMPAPPPPPQPKPAVPPAPQMAQPAPAQQPASAPPPAAPTPIAQAPQSAASTVPTAPAPAMPAATPAMAPKPPAPGQPLAPSFGEGDRVLLAGGPMNLSADAAGSKPGPAVQPNVPLVVTDGELRNNVWVYQVRTPQGGSGWIAEKQLKPAGH
ncbi:MAG: hypothetical protein A4S17_01265 [Proteobacteria bacterium HN_bin10]|nr:MAG: hypothetical protein A4S17_01265 [Proteobacteria bacterium HN_bin10]